MTLANKYRPKVFEDVVQQDVICSVLNREIAEKSYTNSMLFTGPAGVGKTTIARIFASMVDGEVIDIDCASHNGVDDIKEILDNAKTKPLIKAYKCFVLDECVTGDVEILTTEGFKRFDECNGTEVVAQYNNGQIEFVSPIEWINHPYNGDMIKWCPRNWCSIQMTPNHVQPLFYVKSGQVKEKYIKDVNFNENNKLIVSGKGNGTKQTLTYMDRLAIACQADGTIQSHNKNYNHWGIKLKKQRKIDRLLQILNEGDIEYSEIKAQEGCRRFVFNTPVNVTKNLNTYFNLDFNYNGARAFIEEISVWDGYITNDYIEYMSIDKSNVDFISAVAVLGGYNARQRSQVDNRQDKYNTIHKVFLYDMEHMDCQAIRKTVTTKEYKGNVYCVKVPSHQIVIRSQGFVFITGNCHTLSQQAWSSMLITLEENIPHSIFILCTTDIQKIPNTIISRVTRFNFMPMTENSIIDRLKYVCSQENITITDKGIEYIAKSANGNMRQALTNLDKCLLYGLSEAEICKALNIVSEDVMSELYASYGTDRQKTIKLIEDIYNNGYELHLFIRQFLDYCVKKDNLKLVETLLTINNEIRYDDTPKNIIIARLII